MDGLDIGYSLEVWSITLAFLRVKSKHNRNLEIALGATAKVDSDFNQRELSIVQVNSMKFTSQGGLAPHSRYCRLGPAAGVGHRTLLCQFESFQATNTLGE